jgi:hypothetical protein
VKTKLLILIGILIIACAAIIAPVMAAVPTATIYGNPVAIMNVTVPIASQSIALALSPGNTTTYTPTNPSFTVTSNYETWSVSATDSTPGKSAKLGQMVAYNGTASTYDFTKYLGTAMTLSTSTTSGITGKTDLLSTGTTIATGDGSTSAVSAALSVPFGITQTVSYTDPVLPSGSNYQIVVTFTGSTP